jgi:phage tail-like protein
MPSGDQIRDYPSVAVFFRVTVDKESGSLSIPLGNFSTCEGLSIEVETMKREEGGANDFVWEFPVRLKFSNVKLSRPIGPESTKIAAWFAGLAGSGWARTTARIAALTTEGKELVAWNLGGVLPVRWTGPSFSADTPKVATETIELSHQGFVMEEGS